MEDATPLATRCRTLLVALALDAALGELPNALHPVVQIGRWFRLGERLAPEGPRARLAWGAGWLAAGAALVAGAGALVPRQTAAQGAVVSTLLAFRALDRAVVAVRDALARDELEEARRLLGWHLVSRPTADLAADEVAAAAIESLAENLSDSLVAPALAVLAGGLPGLALYRCCNTADAMWGYRTERYEWLGKAAARCDDALNLLPARLTALLIALAARGVTGRGRGAWRVALRDARRTASPNAGWPMAAMAGALDTTLTKRGHYTLGDGARTPGVALIDEALAVARASVGLLVAALVAGAIWRPTGRRGVGRSG